MVKKTKGAHSDHKSTASILRREEKRQLILAEQRTRTCECPAWERHSNSCPVSYLLADDNPWLSRLDTILRRQAQDRESAAASSSSVARNTTAAGVPNEEDAVAATADEHHIPTTTDDQVGGVVSSGSDQAESPTTG